MSAATELLQKGRYRIDSSAALSVGSVSVSPAYDTTSNSTVYVKEIVVRLGKVTTLSQQENNRLAFENAAKRISEFRHESLLQVTDFYCEVGRQYLVLEGVGGENIQSAFANDSQRYPIESVLDWADQLLDALNYLHNQKALHGKVCPKNICLTSEGRVKLLGLSVKDESGNDLSTSLADVDDGSLNYSPLESIWESLDAASQKVIVNSYDERSEKILKEPADVRSDVYSAGATVYFLLTGRVPVDPLERSIELLEGNRDPLPSPNSLDSSIAPEISDVVMRALEIKRESRYDSAMIFRQVLRTSVVRAKEREATEAQELNEAAELMRNTQQLKMPIPAEPVPVEPHATQTAAPAAPSEVEILAQKLKEAEEMRLEAERKMAEVERLMLEQEAERERLEAQAKALHSSIENSVPPATLSPDDDLLGISIEPVRTVENAVQHDLSDVDDEIHLSIKPAPRAKIDLREIAKKSEPSLQQVAIELPKTHEVEAESYLLELSDEPVREEVERPQTYSYNYEEQEPKRSGLPIPLIAGVAVALLIAAGLGFVFLGGSSTPATQAETPVQTQQHAVPVQQAEQQPEQQAAAPVPDQQPAAQTQPGQVNMFNETQQPTEAKPDTAETRPAAKPAQTPKKPVEPAKTPAAKKPVTADDLINDN